jgi:hypothetical protein
MIPANLPTQTTEIGTPAVLKQDSKSRATAQERADAILRNYLVSGRELPLEALSLGNCDDLFE